MNNLLRMRVKDWAKVQGISVLQLVHIRTVIHKGLLQAYLGPKALIIPNRPS